MKTRELIGPALDWAVAKCEGKDRIPHVKRGQVFDVVGLSLQPYRPSTDWSQCWPIVDRQRIEFDYEEASRVYTAADGMHTGQGKTQLIAAMRCYVASKLGDNVDIPEELK